MRHLTPQFAVAALRGGRQVEQFVGPVPAPDEVRAVRWVAAWRNELGYEVWSYDVEDLDDDERRDLMTFPPVGSDGDYEPGAVLIGRSDDPAEVLRLGRDAIGTSPDRWGNQGVAGEDYADFVRARGAHHDGDQHAAPG